MKTLYVFLLLSITTLGSFRQINAQQQNNQQKSVAPVSQQIEYEKKVNTWRATIGTTLQENQSLTKSPFGALKKSAWLDDVRKSKWVGQQGIDFFTKRSAEILAKFDYTTDDAQNLAKNYAINLVDEALNYDRDAASSVFFSDIVIVGRVDTVYMDNTLHDGHFLSYRIIIKEVLKGNAALNSAIIIRDNEFYLKYNSQSKRQELTTKMSDVEIPFVEKNDYMLVLSKSRYEEYMQNILVKQCNEVIDGKLYDYTENTTPAILKLRENCSGVAYKIPLTHGDLWRTPALIKAEIDQIRSLCKNLSVFFSKKLQNKQ